MSEDQLTLLTLNLRTVPDLLRSGAIFEHVQRSPPTYLTMLLLCRSLPLSLQSLPFNSRLFPIGPHFQIGLDWELIVAQWNGVLPAEVFTGNIKTYLYGLSFVDAEMAQAVKILIHGR